MNSLERRFVVGLATTLVIVFGFLGFAFGTWAPVILALIGLATLKLR